MNRKMTRACLLAGSALLTLSRMAYAQASEGAELALDSADQACLQLKDANTWTAKAGYLSGVGTTRSLSYVLANIGSAEPAIALTASTHPPAIGYNSGIRWSNADMATTDWSPQGLTTGSSGSTDFAVVSWNGPGESRVSLLRTTDLNDAYYRNIMLVNPTSAGNYEPVNLHVGGLVLESHYLYVTDFPSAGFRVFDLDQIREIDGSNSTCSGHFGKVGSSWCADGYAYMLPEVNNYYTPANKNNGAAISSSCKPKFSFAGKDTRPSSDLILSGEFCAPPVAGRTDNADRECRGDTSGMNGRLYQWPVDSAGKLVTASGFVTPTKAYYMNERNVQGVAPDMVLQSGAFQNDVYWLSSTKASGALFRVSPSAPAASWRYSDSLMPYAPEGLHASVSGSNLWIVTEGESGNTNPATGGRVYISIHQANVN